MGVIPTVPILLGAPVIGLLVVLKCRWVTVGNRLHRFPHKKTYVHCPLREGEVMGGKRRLRPSLVHKTVVFCSPLWRRRRWQRGLSTAVAILQRLPDQNEGVLEPPNDYWQSLQLSSK